MGQLVFQATLGGQVNLVGPNTASTFNINVPATAGNMVTTGDTGTVTSTMLATSVYTAPGTIGSGTANTGAFTTLTTSSTVTHNGGTANGVAYLNGSKVLTTGSALVFNGTQLGVGTASFDSNWTPVLQVSSAATDGTSGIMIESYRPSLIFKDISASAVRQHIVADASALIFGSGDASFTERMRLDSSGNLGLGVTPSAWSGAVPRAIQVGAGSYLASNTDGTLQLGANGYYNGSNFIYTSTAYAGRYSISTSTGAHSWQTAASGTAGNAITFTQAMTLDASGNLGIGVTSITGGYKAQINGNLLLSSTNPLIVGNSKLTLLGDNTSSTGAIIDSSGNLLVGTTTTGFTNSRSFTFQGVGDGKVYVNHSTANTSGDGYIGFGYNGGQIGSITQNGTTGVLYNLTSDYRLKNDQQPLTGAKEFVMALQPKKWQWWDGSGEGVGFIAHEFMEVAKHSGQGEKDAVDADGKPVYQSIQPSSSEVMANLIAHIQNLETRLAALESN